MTKTAIVILNWNGEKFLQQYLPVLLNNTEKKGVDFVVADNASTDNSIELLKTKFPEVSLIILDKNYGFAGGYNKALEQIDAEYFLLLNSDVEVTKGWLNPLTDFMDYNKEFAACMPTIIDHSNRDKYEYAGAAGGYIDKWGYTFCRGRIFGHTEKFNPDNLQPMSVFWTTGACMLIRSESFKSVDGFDMDFFAHMEEVDLCWRLKNKQQKLAIVPESKVFHVGGGTLPKNNPFKTFLNFRNNLFLLYKNLPDSSVNRTIRKRMIMDGISAIMFLLTFKLKDFKAVYKAHKAFKNEKSRYASYRLENKESNNNQDHQEIYQKSVVADYFLKGKKRFAQLQDGFAVKMDKEIKTI